MRASLLVPIALAGCGWVYDAQLDDRIAELERHRDEFLPAEEQVRFLRAAGSRLYWVNDELPLDEPMLHSFDDTFGEILDYEFSRGASNLEERYRFSAELIADCREFTGVDVYDARLPATLVATLAQPHDVCGIDGRTVYVKVGRDLLRWRPDEGTATTVVLNLDAAGVGDATVDGFAVAGQKAVLAEGGRLWVLDLAAGGATWLMNEPPNGVVVFDDAGVLYDTQNDGVFHIRFDDLAAFSLDEAVKDGGYELNLYHDDLHHVAFREGHTLLGDDVVYRGLGGLFVFDLATRRVQDLLLDRPDAIRYLDPEITTDRVVFTQDPVGGAVYRIRLDDVLLPRQ